MKNIIFKSSTFISILFAGLILCAGEAWGAESAVITIGNSTSVSYANTFTSNSTNTHVTASATSFTRGSSMTTSNSTYSSATAPYSVKYKPSSNINTDEWSDNYSVSAQFTVASGYTFSPTAISATIVTEAANYTYQAILTDGVTSYTSDDVSSSSNGVFTFNFSSLSGTALAGTITFKIRFKSTAKNTKFFVINLPITITGDVASGCSATQPGTISKGTVSGGVITLTAGGTPAADNTWYWQNAADGTATTESGATKDVMTPGTYYIRSYHTDGCWSDARSVVVDAEDFYEPSAAPVITTQPVGASYDAGETVTPLNVAATGSGTLSYQWQKDGVNIPGAIAETYTPNASGSYTCVVSNTEAGHSATSVTSDAAVVNIKSNTYILQGISGTDGTGTLTGDFYTGATTMATVPATSYDGVSYTKGVQLGGKIDSWDSNMSYHDRMIRYDCKTTHTEFTIVVYNKNGSAKEIYVGDIKENPIGTANTVSSLSSYSVSGNSSLTQTYTIDNDKLTPASLYITVENTDIKIVQVIANETGTPLPTPGSVGYTLNFNKPRIGVRSGSKAWLDDPDFEYAPSSNTAAGNSERIQVGTKGTHYIQFRTNQPSAVKIGVQKNPIFYVADNKAGTLNAITIPKKSTDGGAIYTVMVDAGMHYIVPSGSNLSVTSLQILSASKITLSAEGAYNKYTSSVVAVKGNEMPEISILPTRVGYVFGGYYDEPNGAGTQYYNGKGAGMRAWDKEDETATLYAHWVAPCDMEPTLEKVVPVATIWDGQGVDMSLVHLSCDYDTTGIHYSLQSASEAISGCTYAYEDERIYIKGTPALGNTSTVTKTITFTMTNDCSPAHTYTVDATIRIYPAGQRAKIAYIITGTEKASIAEGGNFSAYDTDDANACEGLLTYLNGFYDVTCVNGYATKDEAEIAAYYEQYDLLIVTDFLSTPKGYTNAIGTLIDKKPILSFEAYVAGENGKNWHIDSNPKDPSPKVQDMKILCAGHAIFSDAEGVDVINDADTTVHVLSSLSSETDAKGLQGFVINEAPDFIFLATVKDADNKRDLIVCCERQVVFPARLMLYGINFYEMDNLSPAGRVVMHQMIDYLLMTDESKIADCSLVFDNGAGNTGFNPSAYSGTGTKGDGKWSTAANWAPGYNIIPTPYHPTRIIAECHVDNDKAHAGSVKVNKGKDALGNPVDGILIVEPYGGLTVAGMVAKVNDTRYASPTTIKAEDLIIEADETGNGSFVYGNKESDVRATVQYYSRGEGANTANPVWQYIGIPFQASKTAINMYYEAWMCRWSSISDGALGGLWQWVENNDVLVPFEGYCITQEARKTYTFTGKLNAPVTTTIDLDNYDPADGFAFAANSWTAPIKIQEMKDEDFTDAEKAIYLYHAGSYAAWESKKDDIINPKTSATTPVPGQYVTIPIHSSPYLGADSVIPAMQGFFIKTTSASASLALVYNRVVYDATYFKTSTQPMRAPRRAAQDNAPEVMVLTVAGDKVGGDRVHILSRPDFSENYEDGWDGRKLAGDEALPMLSIVKGKDSMAVAAIPTADERELIFRAGEDSVYTFYFDYEGETMYLYDRLTGEATEIQTGNTYSFEATNKTPMPRFLITQNPPKMPTGIGSLESESLEFREAQKMIIDGQLFILRDNRFYDARGVRVTELKRKEGAQ